MKWRRFVPHILLLIGGGGVAGWNFVERPFPRLVQIRSLTWCTTTPPISTLRFGPGTTFPLSWW